MGWFIAEILEFRIEISRSERHQTNSLELQRITQNEKKNLFENKMLRNVVTIDS